MKNLLFIFLFLTSAVFSQENPWENKNKENPWGAEKKESQKKSEDKKSVEKKKIEKTDSLLSQKKEVFLDTLEESEYNFLLREAGEEAAKNYNAGLDFGVGVASGITLNLYGVLVDLIYIAPTTKKEKNAANEVVNDTTYKNIPPEKLNKETRKKITMKKALFTFAGTALGSLAQLGIIIGIYSF